MMTSQLETLKSRKRWLREQAPKMPEVTRDQLAALWPVTVVRPSEHEYINRQGVAGTIYRDPETRVRFIALVWPTGRADKVLRLYFDLPTGEAFLYERGWSDAKALLELQPELPRRIKDDIEGYIRRHSPSDAAA